MKRRIWISVFAIGCLLTAILLSPTLGNSRAQDNPTDDLTQVRQTLNAIIFPRLTLTARLIAANTATNSAQLTEISASNQTATLLSETQISTPNSLDDNTPTPGVMDPTNQYQTVIANVDMLLTQTTAAQTSIVGTDDIVATINSILIQTLGFTLTPTPTPTFLDMPTLTPNAATLFSQHLTQTVQAQATQTTAALFDAVAQQIADDGATATTTAIKATLVSGYRPITQY